MNVYVLTMYRFGEREKHSYVIGAYSTKEKAEKAGEEEKEWRGGIKYWPEVVELVLDHDYVAGAEPSFPNIVVAL